MNNVWSGGSCWSATNALFGIRLRVRMTSDWRAMSSRYWGWWQNSHFSRCLSRYLSSQKKKNSNLYCSHKLFCEDHLTVIFSSSTWRAFRVYKPAREKLVQVLGKVQPVLGGDVEHKNTRCLDFWLIILGTSHSSCSCMVAQLKCGLKRNAVRGSWHVRRTVTLKSTCFLFYFNIFKFSLKNC